MAHSTSNATAYFWPYKMAHITSNGTPYFWPYKMAHTTSNATAYVRPYKIAHITSNGIITSNGTAYFWPYKMAHSTSNATAYFWPYKMAHIISNGTVEVICYVRPISRGSYVAHNRHLFFTYCSLRNLLVGSTDRTSWRRMQESTRKTRVNDGRWQDT